jgi:hypothetical protein
VPREVPSPHPWRNALIIFGVFLVLAVVTGLIIHFAFTPYEFIDNLPQSSER